MIISQKKTIIENVYSVEVSTTATRGENELFDKFAEPQVNVGGDFTGPPTFSTANAYRKVDSAFPYTFSISAEDDTQAQDKCSVWANAVVARITTEMNILRGLTDSFSGETMVTI